MDKPLRVCRSLVELIRMSTVPTAMQPSGGGQVTSPRTGVSTPSIDDMESAPLSERIMHQASATLASLRSFGQVNSSAPDSPPSTFSDDLFDNYEGNQEQRFSIIVMGITDGKLFAKTTRPLDETTTETVFEEMTKMVNDSEPAFILVRVDKCYNTPYWALISWMPESVVTAERNYWAKAKFTVEDLVASAGGLFYTESYVCTQKSALTYDAYLKTRAAQASACHPLTRPEFLVFHQSLNTKKTTETRNMTVSTDGHKPFPVIPSNVCKRLVRNYLIHKENCLIFSLDSQTTTLNAEACATQSSLGSLANRLYTREPRYYLLRHPGASVTRSNYSIFFLSTPDGSSKLLRVLYATHKGSVVSFLESEKVDVRKSFDVRNAITDLTDSSVAATPDRHPVAVPSAKLFTTSNVTIDPNQVVSVAVKPRPLLTRPITDPWVRLRAAGGLAADPWGSRLYVFSMLSATSSKAG